MNRLFVIVLAFSALSLNGCDFGGGEGDIAGNPGDATVLTVVLDSVPPSLEGIALQLCVEGVSVDVSGEETEVTVESRFSRPTLLTLEHGEEAFALPSVKIPSGMVTGIALIASKTCFADASIQLTGPNGEVQISTREEILFLGKSSLSGPAEAWLKSDQLLKTLAPSQNSDALVKNVRSFQGQFTTK